MINFDHEWQDRSGKKNHGIPEFTNSQVLMADGKDTGLSFAMSFNPNSNDTFDKLWIPFSNTTQIVYDTPSGFSIFTRIMPLTLQAIGGTTTTTGQIPPPRTNNLKYYGGPVLNKYNVAVHNIFWSNEWNDTSATVRPGGGGGTVNASSIRSQMTNTIMPTIVNSQHWDGLWSYGFPNYPKKPVIGGNITWTGTSLPGSVGTDTTLQDGSTVVQACKTAGVVPNYDTFGEDITDISGNKLFAPNWEGKLDYHHIYFIHIPPSRGLLNAGGVSWKSYTNEYGGTPGTVWFLYCMLTYYNDNSTGPLTGPQSAGQAWAHELFHHIGGMDAAGVCQQGFGAFAYSVPGECTWIQHASPNCGPDLVRLSGTNVYTEHYWSDIDGKCIAPGSGESWTPAPPVSTQTSPVIRRYIFQKMDDLDNAATAAIGADGIVYFNVKKAGVEYKVKSTAGAIKINEWSDCWFIFNYATNAAYMYINDIFHNAASTEALTWNNLHSHFILANRNLGASLGQYRGRMDDFRLYRGGVVGATEVENLSGNGLSITGIEKSSTTDVFVVNRVKIDKPLTNTGVFVPGDVVSGDVPAVISSFTSTSFTGTSFTL